MSKPVLVHTHVASDLNSEFIFKTRELLLIVSLFPLAGHEVSRIVSCIVAKRADETAYWVITYPLLAGRLSHSPLDSVTRVSARLFRNSTPLRRQSTINNKVRSNASHSSSVRSVL